jgi:hypothetical protein
MTATARNARMKGEVTATNITVIIKMTKMRSATAQPVKTKERKKPKGLKKAPFGIN